MVNQISVQGKVIYIGNFQRFSDKFGKAMLVIKTNERYPQEIPIEFFNDKAKSLYNLNVNDEVTVFINLRGRSYVKDNKKNWIASVNGWKVEKILSDKPNPQSVSSYPEVNAYTMDDIPDDLPF